MPRRKLGQHYLINGAVLGRIAAAVCEPDEPLVIEIGPGRGALTERLLARAQRVVAIEIDGWLVEDLGRRFAGETRLEIVHADVLETDLARWGSAAFVGNLPYYITSPILERIVRARGTVRRAVLMVQKEVAERMTAGPGSRDYGYLTVALALFYEARLLSVVPPTAFHPPPKVDSAVVRLDPHGRGAALGITDPAAFLAFVARSFHQKRKTLRNNLSGAWPKEKVDALPEAGLRAEQLTLESFATLYRRLVG